MDEDWLLGEGLRIEEGFGLMDMMEDMKNGGDGILRGNDEVGGGVIKEGI
ncbi:hypothetical protein [Bacillus pumilus]|nr:hypothetical protein [Bacillus pumilus]